MYCSRNTLHYGVSYLAEYNSADYSTYNYAVFNSLSIPEPYEPLPPFVTSTCYKALPGSTSLKPVRPDVYPAAGCV
jgi:hypothetical protein